MRFDENFSFSDSKDLGSLIAICEYAVWKFQDFSAAQILREINFGHFDAPKIAIFIIWAGLNFEYLCTFGIFKCEIFLIIKTHSLQNC